MNVCIDFDTRQARLTDPLMNAALAQAPTGEVLRLAEKLQQPSEGYSKALVAAVIGAIESRGLVDSPELSTYLMDESKWRTTPVGQWLVAMLLEQRGELERALIAWDQVIRGQRGDMHEAYLSRSRLRSRLGNLAGAFADLRQAVTGQEEYSFLARAAKQFVRLRGQGTPAFTRKARIALLSSTTTDLIAPLLRLACFRDGVDAEIYTAAFGNFRQEILNPASGLYAFKPDFVIIATHWRDANLPAFSGAPESATQQVISDFQQLWQLLLERHECRIIQHNFDLPGIDSYGHLGLGLTGGQSHILREINRRLAEIAPTAVAVLDIDQVSSRYGKLAWFDAPYWHLAKQYPATNALPLLVDHQVALIRAGLGLTKKVLALDLDNTLWGGVIGEDGLEGIRLGPPSAAGEAHQALQRYALELKERGILLAVCSKNNEEDAKLPFLHHDASLLHLDDFVIFRANWQDKPSNLREIASALSLGIDSFVFLDDNPVERALVRQELPEVAVPELGRDPATFVAALDRGLYFEAWTLSQEDRERHEGYRANVMRTELETSVSSLEEFLTRLGMEAEIGPFDEYVLARVVQLIGKTNQFNLTTRRYSDQQVRHMVASDQYWTQFFRLKDRFGDNGLIGIMIARLIPSVTPTWEIDTWLMSCRVIGRQMEEFMLQTLVDAAKSRGIQSLQGAYIPTAKNRMVQDLYIRLGFTKIAELPDGETRYLLDLTSEPLPRCEFIRVRNTA